MIVKLMEKLRDNEKQRFSLSKTLTGHLLPITTCCHGLKMP